MTNEQKAKEIAEYLNQPNGSNSLLQCHQAALYAMQWKDEEHQAETQKLIDEACKWLEVNDSYAKPTHLQVDRLREHLNNIK